MTRLPLVLGALGLATAFQLGTAEAGHVHFGGGGHFSGGGGFHGSVHGSVHVGGGGFASRSFGGYRGGYRGGYHGGYHGPRGWGVGGHVWVGGGYYGYYPRSYYYYYGPEYVPSYYGGSYYPVQPAGPAVVAEQPALRPPLPRFGIGAYAGGISVDDNRKDSNDYGVLARIRLTDGLILEGDVGKTSYEKNERTDRRFGGTLIYEFGARNALAPYILGGIGVQQARVEDTYTTTQDFAEAGIGLRLSLSRNLALTADIRVGSRKTVDSKDQDTLTSKSVVAPPSESADDNENYTRGRIAAVLYF